MPADNDEGRPGRGALIVEQTATTLRPIPPIVMAISYEVVGTRGRRRVVLLVTCPFCG
jgi:hypothetical protein